MKKWSLWIAAVLLLAACKKNVNNPEEDSAHGAVTTVSIKFSQGGVQKYEAIFDDPDGPGGAAPIRFDEIVLDKGQTYQAVITLTNKTKTPAEDMTATIKEAGHQHQFFFVPTGITGLSINATDRDRINLPIGLETTWQTPATAQNGSIRVALRHIAFGKNAGSTITSGHSDIQIDFATKLQ